MKKENILFILGVLVIMILTALVFSFSGCNEKDSDESALSDANGEISDYEGYQSFASAGLKTSISKTVRPPQLSDSTTVTIGFKCNNAPCKFKCKLDLDPWQKCKSPIIYTALGDGSHTFRVKATDKSGNTSRPAKYTWHTVIMYLTPDDPNKIVTDSNGNEIASNKIIISFQDSVTQTDIDAIVSSLNGTITGFIPQIGFYEVEVPTTTATEIENLITTLLTNPLVKTAEKDFVGTIDGSTDLTDIEKRINDGTVNVWGFKQIHADDAFACIRQKKIPLTPPIIAILDNSFVKHPEISSKIVSGSMDYADADDHPDYQPDAPLQTIDYYMHGTWVAGIAAAANNGEGINGMSYPSRLLLMKVFTSKIPPPGYFGPPTDANSDGDYLDSGDNYDGDTISNSKDTQHPFGIGTPNQVFLYKLAGAIYSAAFLEGVKVINLSLGGYHNNPSDDDAVAYLQTAINFVHDVYGVTIVASAGNDGIDASRHIPSSLDNVIAVGATDQSGERLSWSNFGPTVDLYAPGDKIWSLNANRDGVVPQAVMNMFDQQVPESELVYGGGTSIATPFVSGLAGLLKSIDPGLSPSDIEGILENTANGKRINALKAVEEVSGEICCFSYCPEPGSADDEEVFFPDPGLEAVIRAKISKPSGKIYKSDVCKIAELDGGGITNLAGIENLTALRFLDIGHGSISNLKPLACLTNLTELDLEHNSISDISPLAGLTNLNWLCLNENQISDISPLAGLTNLTDLHLWYNSISDISPLAGLTKLSYLDLYHNSISDITPLVKNPGLGSGDHIELGANPFDWDSCCIDIPALGSRGVDIVIDFYDCGIEGDICW